jgi:hypothetical protein
VPGELTNITEIATALGMVAPSLEDALAERPAALNNVPNDVWAALVTARGAGQHLDSFQTAFANGQAFALATDGLRNRPALRVEWKGRHRPPGDDVVPADLRIDHVYLVSCKYLSKVLLNPGPARLFERRLVGDERAVVNWFAETAPAEFQALYAAARTTAGLAHLPALVTGISRADQSSLKAALSERAWPIDLQPLWVNLCTCVARESAKRWASTIGRPRDRLRLFWRLLRITTVTYFVLGTDRSAHIRLRVDSAWDWAQSYELRAFEVAARAAGQAEVGWRATIRRRSDLSEVLVDGHVEVRWSHGRFVGAPESKVYLDTPHDQVPGYNVLA